jgi:hypothetical protein
LLIGDEANIAVTIDVTPKAARIFSAASASLA